MNGTVDLLHAVGNGADVVLMPMGNEHTPQLLLIGNQIGKIGDYQIHTIHILFREANAAVYYDHILAIFQNGNVFTDLIQSAQGNNF